jgi:hypothetical protein
MLTFDMTVQLAPVVWGMVGLLLASGVGIIALALPRTRPAAKTSTRTTPAFGRMAVPASA